MGNVLDVKNDLYGGLYRVVKNALQKFCDSLAHRPTRFQLFHADALEFPGLLAGKHSFDRIEVGVFNCL